MADNWEMLQQAEDLALDERWQLVLRIVAAPSFQRSERLRDFLLYAVERSLHGHNDALTEQQIGRAVFGKPLNYSPVEDSAVRVQARHLRIKLSEYFTGPGRDEPLLLEIPKGCFVPQFHSAKAMPVLGPLLPIPAPAGRPTSWMPWAIAALLAILCAVLGANLYVAKQRDGAFRGQQQIEWPLSRVADGLNSTMIVVSDASLGMLRLLSGKALPLAEYIGPGFGPAFQLSDASAREAKLLNFLSQAALTSYADVVALKAILGAAPSHNLGSMSAVSARDVRPRDLRHGNCILVGGPFSNPWVSLFESHLNFEPSQDTVGAGKRYFLNRKPIEGEPRHYQGLKWTGTSGAAYATIALLPNGSESGNIMILQGLEQEGTEAAALFVTSPEGAAKLRAALTKLSAKPETAYFEALIRATAIAGAPSEAEVISTRLIQ